MFNTKNNYEDSKENTAVDVTFPVKINNNNTLIVVNFLLISLLTFSAFKYLQSNTNIFIKTSSAISKQAVLGVSETIKDDEFVNILKSNKAERVRKNSPTSMQIIMNEPSIQSKTSYTEAIARKLDDKSGFRGKIAVVNNTNDEF